MIWIRADAERPAKKAPDLFQAGGFQVGGENGSNDWSFSIIKSQTATKGYMARTIGRFVWPPETPLQEFDALVITLSTAWTPASEAPDFLLIGCKRKEK
jgi:hypothetical protein